MWCTNMNSSLGNMGYFGWVGMGIFWIAFIWLVVWLIRQNKENPKDTPTEILKERFFKGELTKKQFYKMKNDFKKS